MCEKHDDCIGNGGKCCGDYCCNPEYFEALQQIICNPNDDPCSVRFQIIWGIFVPPVIAYKVVHKSLKQCLQISC